MRPPTAAIVLVCAATTAHADVLHVGERVVELDVAVDRAGKPFKLASLRGHWFVVTVGAAWCAPCKKELPIWDRLAAKHRGRIVFVAVSLDDDPEDGKKFHERLGLSHMRLAYMPSASSAVADRYGALTMPSTFVIDPSGVVRFVKSGFEKNDPEAEYRQLDAELDKLVPATATAPPSPKHDDPPPPKHDDPPPSKHDAPPPSKHDDPKPPKHDPKPVETATRPELPSPHTIPAESGTSPTDPEPPFERGFVFDLDFGAGLGRWGPAAQASGLGAVALSPAIAVGLRFGVGSVRYASPGYGEYGLAAGALDFTHGKLTVGAAAGAGVVDQHGGFAFDVRGGYEVYRLGANHFLAGLDFVDLYGTHGVAALTITVGLHHR